MKLPLYLTLKTGMQLQLLSIFVVMRGVQLNCNLDDISESGIPIKLPAQFSLRYLELPRHRNLGQY